MSVKRKMPKVPPKGMHRMPDGMMMSDAEHQAMMGDMARLNQMARKAVKPAKGKK